VDRRESPSGHLICTGKNGSSGVLPCPHPVHFLLSFLPSLYASRSARTWMLTTRAPSCSTPRSTTRLWRATPQACGGGASWRYRGSVREKRRRRNGMLPKSVQHFFLFAVVVYYRNLKRVSFYLTYFAFPRVCLIRCKIRLPPNMCVFLKPFLFLAGEFVR